MELEADLKTGCCVRAQRMHVGGRKDQFRTSLEKPSRVRVEEVGVTPNLVDRPPLAVRCLCSFTTHRGPYQVVEDVEPPDRLSVGSLL